MSSTFIGMQLPQKCLNLKMVQVEIQVVDILVQVVDILVQVVEKVVQLFGVRRDFGSGS